MKTDITYGWVSGALFIYVDAIPETDYDKEIQGEYVVLVQQMIDGKLKGTEYDDGNFMAVNFDSVKKDHLNEIIYRVVNTISMEYDIPFKARVIHVKE